MSWFSFFSNKYLRTFKSKEILSQIPNKSIAELIDLLEKDKLSEEAQNSCKKHLAKFNKKEVLFHVDKYWKKYIKSELKLIIISQKIPTSFFLNEQQIKRLIKKERKQQKQNSEDFASGESNSAAW